jgi:hypothetical protein
MGLELSSPMAPRKSSGFRRLNQRTLDWIPESGNEAYNPGIGGREDRRETVGMFTDNPGMLEHQVEK